MKRVPASAEYMAEFRSDLERFLGQHGVSLARCSDRHFGGLDALWAVAVSAAVCAHRLALLAPFKCTLIRSKKARRRVPASAPHRVTAYYQAPSRAIARQLATGIRADYANVLPSALACFEDDFESCIAHLRLPVTHRRFVRTTNLLERLFVEERRRLKIIPNGFGEKPVLKLMFGALIRAAERWRGLRFTEFELRQIAAVRKDLDDEYQTLITPRAASSQPRISSKSKP